MSKMKRMEKVRKGMKARKERIKKSIGRAKNAGKIGREKVKNGIVKVKAGKERVKSGIGKVRRKVQLIKPILLVDGITLSNAMFGLLSIFASIKGHLNAACYFMIMAAVLDFLDGKFARKFGRTTALGKELDSLADIVSFGVAPAVLGFVYLENIFIAIPIVIFVSCGIIRLAKFNVQLVKGSYFGMPITWNALWFSLLYFFSVPNLYWFYAYAISAALMVTPFKLKKVV
jgi:CDP-diacylglycerol--serine O-phosphatidyltransferase